MEPHSIFNFRCNICNKVSSPEISSFDGEHYSGKFHRDPEGFGYLCSDCFSEAYYQEDDYPPTNTPEYISNDFDEEFWEDYQLNDGEVKEKNE